MARLRIETGLDPEGPDLGVPAAIFRESGLLLLLAARGVDERPVRADRIRKSVGAETKSEPTGAGRWRSFADATLVVAIVNLWWPMPITV